MYVANKQQTNKQTIKQNNKQTTNNQPTNKQSTNKQAKVSEHQPDNIMATELQYIALKSYGRGFKVGDEVVYEATTSYPSKEKTKFKGLIQKIVRGFYNNGATCIIVSDTDGIQHGSVADWVMMNLRHATDESDKKRKREVSSSSTPSTPGGKKMKSSEESTSSEGESSAADSEGVDDSLPWDAAPGDAEWEGIPWCLVPKGGGKSILPRIRGTGYPCVLGGKDHDGTEWVLRRDLTRKRGEPWWKHEDKKAPARKKSDCAEEPAEV